MRLALAMASAFILGSLPVGLWWGLALRGMDVRQHGSRNLGATNVYRVLGPVHGVAVLLLDAGKGAAAVLVARALGLGPQMAMGAGAVAIIGHTVSPWVRFRGGKGVATGLGVWVSIAPLPALLALAVWLLFLVTTRRVSVASLAAATALPVLVAVTPGTALGWPGITLASLTAALVWVRHRGNLARLARGQEPPLWGSRA